MSGRPPPGLVEGSPRPCPSQGGSALWGRSPARLGPFDHLGPRLRWATLWISAGFFLNSVTYMVPIPNDGQVRVDNECGGRYQSDLPGYREHFPGGWCGDRHGLHGALPCTVRGGSSRTPTPTELSVQASCGHAQENGSQDSQCGCSV